MSDKIDDRWLVIDCYNTADFESSLKDELCSDQGKLKVFKKNHTVYVRASEPSLLKKVMATFQGLFGKRDLYLQRRSTPFDKYIFEELIDPRAFSLKDLSSGSGAVVRRFETPITIDSKAVVKFSAVKYLITNQVLTRSDVTFPDWTPFLTTLLSNSISYLSAAFEYAPRVKFIRDTLVHGHAPYHMIDAESLEIRSSDKTVADAPWVKSGEVVSNLYNARVLLNAVAARFNAGAIHYIDKNVDSVRVNTRVTPHLYELWKLELSAKGYGVTELGYFKEFQIFDARYTSKVYGTVEFLDVELDNFEQNFECEAFVFKNISPLNASYFAELLSIAELKIHGSEFESIATDTITYPVNYFDDDDFTECLKRHGIFDFFHNADPAERPTIKFLAWFLDSNLILPEYSAIYAAVAKLCEGHAADFKRKLADFTETDIEKWAFIDNATGSYDYVKAFLKSVALPCDLKHFILEDWYMPHAEFRRTTRKWALHPDLDPVLLLSRSDAILTLARAFETLKRVDDWSARFVSV